MILPVTTCLGVSVPATKVGLMSPSVRWLKPIWFSEMAIPMEAPTPVCPTAMATDAAITVLRIWAVDSALTDMSPAALVMSEPTISATSPPLPMRLREKAPAPAMATPVCPKPAASAAAMTVAFTIAVSSANRSTTRPSARMPAARCVGATPDNRMPPAMSVTVALVLVEMRFSDMLAPTAMAMPCWPTATESEAAPTKLRMRLLFTAITARLSASIAS